MWKRVAEQQHPARNTERNHYNPCFRQTVVRAFVESSFIQEKTEKSPPTADVWRFSCSSMCKSTPDGSCAAWLAAATCSTSSCPLLMGGSCLKIQSFSKCLS